MTLTTEHTEDTWPNGVASKRNIETKERDEDDEENTCNSKLVLNNSDGYSFDSKKCSVLYKQKSSPQESENETKSSLLSHQSSKDDDHGTTEDGISTSSTRGCRQACKEITFHQCLVFTCIFFNVFICVGLPFSLSVLYPEFKVAFNSSNAEAATIVSVATGLITCGGIFGGLLVNKIGSRFTILLGAILSFVGTFASFFAINIWFLVISLGVLMGLGNAIVYIPSMVVISEQFPNLLMVTMLITVARPAGVITLPLVINALLDVYSWRGTLLLCSSFVLNICVGGLIATHKSPSTSVPVPSPTKKKIFDTSVLKIPKFLLIMIAHSITNSTVGAVFVFIVDFAMEQGHTREQAVIILTTQAAFAMCARGVVGILSILPHRIRPPHVSLYFLAAHCGSVLILLAPVVAQNYKNFIGLMVLWGLFVGIRNAIIPVLCLEIVGQERYPIALGVSQTFIGVFTIIAGPIGGMIRDITGNYTITFYTSGSIGLVASFISTILYIVFFTSFFKCSKKKSDVQV